MLQMYIYGAPPPRTYLFMRFCELKHWFCEGALAKLISGASSPKFGDLGFYGFYWFCQCFLLLGLKNIGN